MQSKVQKTTPCHIHIQLLSNISMPKSWKLEEFCTGIASFSAHSKNVRIVMIVERTAVRMRGNSKYVAKISRVCFFPSLQQAPYGVMVINNAPIQLSQRSVARNRYMCIPKSPHFCDLNMWLKYGAMKILYTYIGSLIHPSYSFSWFIETYNQIYEQNLNLVAVSFFGTHNLN